RLGDRAPHSFTFGPYTPLFRSAAAALLVAIYAGGYAFAAVRPGPWMRPLEPTNVIAAVATLAVILALFSPLADPARLSVNDQMRDRKSTRLNSSHVKISYAVCC